MEVSNSLGRGFQEITSKDAKHKIGSRKTIQVVILYLLWGGLWRSALWGNSG